MWCEDDDGDDIDRWDDDDWSDEDELGRFVGWLAPEVMDRGYAVISSGHYETLGENMWTTTVGLRENTDHPDLYCIGLDQRSQATLIGALAEVIAEAGEVPASLLDRLHVTLVPLRPHELTPERVEVWERHMERAADEGDFVQVVVGSCPFCDAPASGVARVEGNRAARRAAARAERRRDRRRRR
jgi:hypothetical protein